MQTLNSLQVIQVSWYLTLTGCIVLCSCIHDDLHPASWISRVDTDCGKTAAPDQLSHSPSDCKVESSAPEQCTATQRPAVVMCSQTACHYRPLCQSDPNLDIVGPGPPLTMSVCPNPLAASTGDDIKAGVRQAHKTARIRFHPDKAPQGATWYARVYRQEITKILNNWDMSKYK